MTTTRAIASPRKPTRLTADERREAIISAAVQEFSRKGFEGTSTDAIARLSGVSQPYLFQLFGTKRDLFIATVRRAFERTRRAFEAAAEAARATDRSTQHILSAMGAVYCDLLRDNDLLQCQLQAYAACSDPEIRAAVRAEFHGLYHSVSVQSGADRQTLDDWFAHGMLMNTVAAMAPELAYDGENLTLASLDPVAARATAPSPHETA